MQPHKKFVIRLVLIFAILLASVPAHAGSLAVDLNKSVTISVAASGSAPFTYQWKKDGVDIAGATSSSYSIALATASSAGSYTALVSNALGSTISDATILTVNGTTSTVIAPSITTQPVAQTVMQGSVATFSVVATGTSPSYQWYKNAVAISGATGSTYSIAATTLTDAGSYSVVVSNSAGSVSSLSVNLAVNAIALAPTITTQPVALTVSQGNPATFSVVASGTSLNYQWLKNGLTINGATTANYTLASTVLADAGVYSVIVSNTAGSVTSSSAALTVNTLVTAPTITTQPVAQSVMQGSAATFTVIASGTSLSYQWYKNGVAISGANSSSCMISAAASTDAGTYSVVVSNTVGSVTSSAVLLTVNSGEIAPAITAQPVPLTVTAGSPATFSVVATGTNLRYQWLKNERTSIDGAASSSYTIPSVTSADAGTYLVYISNTAGYVVSTSVALTVNTAVVAPTITTQPVSLTVTQGGSATFTVVASGTSLSYYWSKNGVAISGATSSSYTIAATALTDAASYSVVVSNTAGSVTSSAAALTVNSGEIAPAIVTQPVALTVTEGSPATFSVVATGTSLRYQWLKNDTTSIAGAASSSYTIPSVTLADAGTYLVYISNTTGYVVSSSVTLTVNSSMGFAEVTPSSYSARGANSSAEGVAMLFDGSTTTKWVDNSAFTWVQMSFAAPTALDAYSLTSGSDAPERDPISWTLSGSNDGVTWNVIETRSSQSWATRQLTRDFVLATRSAAYTQYRFNFNATSGSITQLAELELYGSSVVSARLTPSSYSARGQANKNYAIAKLFDGSVSTRWIDYSATSWVQIKMNAATTLRRYTLTSGSDSSSYDPIAWTLSGSNDGINWTVIETRSGQSWSSRKLKRDFTLATASSKYVWFRFNFQVAAGSTTTQLAELESFGEQ